MRQRTSIRGFVRLSVSPSRSSEKSPGMFESILTNLVYHLCSSIAIEFVTFTDSALVRTDKRLLLSWRLSVLVSMSNAFFCFAESGPVFGYRFLCCQHHRKFRGHRLDCLQYSKSRNARLQVYASLIHDALIDVKYKGVKRWEVYIVEWPLILPSPLSLRFSSSWSLWIFVFPPSWILN